MIDTSVLRKALIKCAIEGHLVHQDSNDEPVSELFERIKSEKKRLIKEKKIKTDKNGSSIFLKNGIWYEQIGEEIRDISNEIPFEIPEDWSWCRINHIAEIGRGGSPRPIKKFLTEDSNGINWIKIGDTEIGGKYIYKTKEKITKEGSLQSRSVKIGDLLLTNSMSFGRPYILKTNGCIHDGWLVISPYLNFNTDFLYYVLSSDCVFTQFNKLAAGAVVSNLNAEKVATILIPTPPIEEQQRIVDKLENLFTLINDVDESQAELDSINVLYNGVLKKSILQKAIEGKLVYQDATDEPVSEILNRIKIKKKRLVGEKKIKTDKKESIIYKSDDGSWCEKVCNEVRNIDKEIRYEIPDSWAWVRLKDACILNMGQSVDIESLGEEGIEFHQGKIYFSDKYIKSSNIFTTKPTKIVEPNTILMCVRAPVGNINLTDRRLCIGRGLCGIIPIEGILDLKYCYYILLTYKKDFEEKATGTTFKSIATKEIAETLIPIPPFQEQQRIANKIDELFKYIM